MKALKILTILFTVSLVAVFCGCGKADDTVSVKANSDLFECAQNAALSFTLAA